MSKFFINNDGIRTVTRQEAEESGIDLSMITVCKKLRQLAKLERVRLDETGHQSELNRHLLDYIKYCGKTPLEYIKRYLADLQPYMIVCMKDQDPQKSYICVIDMMYRVSVNIKSDNIFGEEIIVSFPEDNVHGITKPNTLIENNINTSLVSVFAESICGINNSNGRVALNAYAIEVRLL